MDEKPANTIDKSFQIFIENIRIVTADVLLEQMIHNYEVWTRSVSQEKSKEFLNLTNSIGLWGAFEPEKKNYDMLYQRVNCLKEHLEDIVWLYDKLSDYRSKLFLLSLLLYWIELNPNKMKHLSETTYNSYFDLDLITCTEEEVFVDLGAFIGDTAINYLASFGEAKYRKMYCYEILERNINKMRDSLAKYPNINIRAKGVADHNGIMYMSDTKYLDATQLATTGTKEIEVVKLDDDILEPISFLKMDIEGSEYNAIKGAARHIKDDQPKLAVCLYHSNNDLWRIPRLIDSISLEYNYYIRYYRNDPDSKLIADYVLYCIPKKK